MNQNSKIRLPGMAVYLFMFIVGGHFQNASALNVVGNTSSNSDSLTYIGHATVKIKTSDGKVIYIDPYAGTSADYADSADIVLITHEHFDHNVLTLVHQKSTCQVIRSATANISGVYQTFTIGNVTITKITSVAAYNNQPRNLQWHLKAQCVGYVVEFNGVKLYHAGDTGNIPEMADLASQNITYALLPMDSIYTMSPAEATQAAAMIQAKHDIPIHTMPPPDTYSNAMVSRFTSPNKLVVHPGETIALSTSTTSVKGTSAIPLMHILKQNYPNPFNPGTQFEFTLGASSFVSLAIFDILGKKVATLISEKMSAGDHSIYWNASTIPSGMYFYRLQTEGFVETKKLIVLK
jgi:L-ascorbate metabolism protein UlaG (beta-lactamase superfamily)